MFEVGLDHPAAFTAFAGFLLVFAFYVLGWWLTGRDPAPAQGCDDQGTPPENLSPSALRYAHRMAADTEAAAVALMSLAARGHLVMDWEGGRVRLRKTEAPEKELPPAEAVLAHDLLYTRSTLVLRNTANTVVAPALRHFRRKLAREYGHILFRANRGWLVAGLVLSALIVGAAAAQSGAPLAFLVLSGLAVAAVAGLAALAQALLPHRYIFPEPLTRGLRFVVRRAVEAGFILVASPLAFVALARTITDPPVPLTAVGFVAALAGLHVLVYHLIKAPTVPGAGTRQRIESFRMALSGEKTLAGDRPLPDGIYAFALDAPREPAAWTEPPAWLRIVEPDSGTPHGYEALGEALTRALDAAAMPPAAALFGDTPREAPAVQGEAAQ